MLKISHEKNEFLYGAQRVVFFEPFVSLISGGGFVLGEIQRIKHQKALEYWSQILKEQQHSCGKMVVHVGSVSLEIPAGTAAPDLQLRPMAWSHTLI